MSEYCTDLVMQGIRISKESDGRIHMILPEGSREWMARQIIDEVSDDLMDMIHNQTENDIIDGNDTQSEVKEALRIDVPPSRYNTTREETPHFNEKVRNIVKDEMNKVEILSVQDVEVMIKLAIDSYIAKEGK